MSFQYDKLKSDCLTAAGDAQSVVETVLSESVASGIDQILSLSAEARPVSVEVQEGEALVAGRVNFKLVYLSDAEPKSVDIFADFSERIFSDNLTPRSRVFAEMSIIDTETARDGSFKMRAVVETALTVLCERETECLKDADESVHVSKKAISMTKHISSANGMFEVSEEQAVGTNIAKILLLDTRVAVTDARAGEGVILLSGEAAFTVLYYADEVINELVFTLPFNEELSAAGVSLSDIVSGSAAITSAKLVLLGEEGNNIIRVKADVRLRADAFMPTEEEIISDGFSLFKELEFEAGEHVVESYKGMEFFYDKISGVAVLSQDMSAAREIAGIAGARNNIASIVSSDDAVTVEGVVTATVIYTDENGLNSVKLEVPYSSTYDSKLATDTSVLKIDAYVKNVSARVKRDREIEVFADIGLKADVYDTKTYDCITNVLEGADKPQNESTFSVYIASEGESIWDAVKALSATPDDILKQNPDLVLPFKDGDKVVFFRKLSLDVV